MLKISDKDIEEAYLSLKRSIYYENNVLLYLKKQIADFEDKKHFLKSIERDKFFKNLCNKINNEDQEFFNDLISEVKYKKVIKKLKEKDSEENSYEIDYNYIIDCPIELHIISTLWIFKEGYKLDEKVEKYSYGYRLDKYNKDILNNEKNLKKFCIFKRYAEQYQTWRNNGLKEIRRIIEEDENVVLINLDLKRFYYSIDHLRLNKILQEIPEVKESFLTKIILEINKKYSSIVNEEIKEKKTLGEEKIDRKDSIIPIGLYSSAILANFYLKDLDKKILELSPNYYGRYVDDMILVFKEYKSNEINKKNYLKEKVSLIIEKDNLLGIDKAFNQEILNENKKQKINFFDGEKKKLKILELENKFLERASTFAFLPNEEEIEKLYKKISNEDEIEPKNKKYNVAVYLAKILNIFSGLDRQKDIKKYIDDLMDFFHEENLVKYFVYYEKIFTLLVMGELTKEIEKLYKKIEDIFSKHEKGWEKKDLTEYLKISFYFALALNPSLIKKFSYNFINILESNRSNLLNIILKIVNSNMFKHNLINYPLLNYLDFDNKKIEEINFLKARYFDFAEKPDELDKLSLHKEKLFLSPRFIHLNEFNIFYIKRYILGHKKEEIDYFVESKKDFINNFKYQTNIFEGNISREKGDPNIDFYKIGKKGKKNLKKIRIGIASLRIEPDVLKVLNGKQDLSLEKKKRMIDILNMSKKSNVDILVFSETSIPFQWIRIINEFSRKNQILVTGGFEHIHCPKVKYKENNQKYAFNYLFTTLPFHTQKYQTSFIKVRLKNHYSPYERQIIEGNRFCIPEETEKKYDVFSWNGIYFSNFNCFELADIEARSRMKNYIDLLIASVFNKDTYYFKNILESTCRDLHVYIAQSNTSIYGDCEIIQPTKKDEMIIGYTKGGINDTLLVGEINIEELREFQIKENDVQSLEGKFKLTPPGIDPDIVTARKENRLEEYFKPKMQEEKCKDE